MSKAYEYRIIDGDSFDVEKEVKSLTESGWQIHGNLIMTLTGAGIPFYAQAMVKAYEQPGAWG